MKQIEMPVRGDVVTLEDLSTVCVEEVCSDSDSFLASDPSGEEFEVCFSLIASVN